MSEAVYSTKLSRRTLCGPLRLAVSLASCSSTATVTVPPTARLANYIEMVPHDRHGERRTCGAKTAACTTVLDDICRVQLAGRAFAWFQEGRRTVFSEMYKDKHVLREE